MSLSKRGLIGTLLRYPYEVRSEEEYFDEIQDVKVTKDMHIVNQKPGLFLPEKFDDQYETALIDLISQKRSGQPITKKDRPAGGNVVDLMEALRRNVGGAEPAKASKASKKARKAASGQKEMLMPIEGKRPRRRRRRSRRPSREGSRPSLPRGQPGPASSNEGSHETARHMPRGLQCGRSDAS